ncbi:MAG TPA: ADOP family duplicated permease [Acidobacteriota bacterium]|nr:ADOP family duplicated permease [Acidobacteriota bacterium]
MRSRQGRPRPPIGGAASWLLRRLIDPRWREEVEGDVEELYLRRLRQGGPWRARARLYLDVLSAARIGPERFAIRRLMRRPKGSSMLANLKQDLTYSLRRLTKSPLFGLICVLTLALGIGANTAMFSLVNGILLEPLPYYDSDRLVRIHTSWKNFGYGALNSLEYQDIVEGTESFQGVALYDTGGVNLHEGSGRPERIESVGMTPSLLTVLGITPQLGRALKAQEGTVPHHRVLLLSDGLWKRRFGGDEKIIGQTLQIAGHAYEVIGVMPQGFQFPYAEVDIWTGYGIDPDNQPHRGAHGSRIVARLHRGASLKQAQAELDALSARLRQEHSDNYPEGSGFRFVAEPLSESITGSVRPALLILMGAVGLVLLIACANVAGLLLARISTRQREIAIRRALGAGAGRLMGQILCETFLLSLLGGIGGLAVAQFGFSALKALHPGSLPRLQEVTLSINVLYFNLALVIVAALAAGLIPALRMTRSRNRLSLSDRGGESQGFRQSIRRGLVVMEVTLATVLLLGAGLLIRSFQHLTEVDPGFRPENLLTAKVSLPRQKYSSSEERVQFYRQVLEDVQGRAGVISAGVINLLPMSGNDSDWSVAAEGYTPPDPEVPDFVQFRIVSPRYFDTMGIPLVRGRAFQEADVATRSDVAIISQSLARRFWGEEDAVGRRIKPGGPNSDAPWLTVVGVVGDVHHGGARQGEVPIWYRPLDSAWTTMSLAVRTTGDPQSALKILSDSVAKIDPNLPLYDTQVMTQMVSGTLAQERFQTNLLIAFAALALGLAAVGVYGVISFSVSRRTREIGVRMALGAPRRRILLQVLREGVLLIAIGLAIGLAASVPVTQFMDSMLFGVTPYDPVTFIAIAAVLAAAGLAACLGPARRATRVDPMVALRYE